MEFKPGFQMVRSVEVNTHTSVTLPWSFSCFSHKTAVNVAVHTKGSPKIRLLTGKPPPKKPNSRLKGVYKQRDM